MKRDIDLVREILQFLESRPPGDRTPNVEIRDRSLDELRLHLRLMEDAGLVEGVSMTGNSVFCNRITWHGYEFLETMRKDTHWAKAKQLAIRATGGLSLLALKEAAKQIVKAAVNDTANTME